MSHEQFLPILEITVSFFSTFVFILLFDFCFYRPLVNELNRRLEMEGEIAARRAALSEPQAQADVEDAFDPFELHLQESGYYQEEANDLTEEYLFFNTDEEIVAPTAPTVSYSNRITLLPAFFYGGLAQRRNSYKVAISRNQFIWRSGK
jgi:hypothetical protein